MKETSGDLQALLQAIRLEQDGYNAKEKKSHTEPNTPSVSTECVLSDRLTTTCTS